MQLFRRKEAAWEVVDSHAIDPVATYLDDDCDDLDIVSISDTDASRKYVFELKDKDISRSTVATNAIVFARQELMKETMKKNGSFNIFLQEAWRCTLYRRGKMYRIEVEYTARPGRTLNKPPPAPRSPPFIALLTNSS